MVFQDSGLFPWMSVETNVGFGLMTRGVPRRRGGPAGRRGAQAGRPDQIPPALSAPAFRRHAPAQRDRARLRHRSGVLLMDEPFAALDAQNRVILQAELVRIWEQTRKTVVYITHSIEEALLLGDRCVVMTAQPGRIKEIIDVPFPHPRNLIDAVGARRIRQAQARHLARAGGRGDARARGDRRMSGCPPRPASGCST